jgi:GMP synthase (glutamine-hydrolysing)
VCVLSIVHQPDAGPGVFAPVLAENRHVVEEWRPDLTPAPRLPAEAYAATLVFGGAMHVDQEAEHPWLRAEKQLLTELVERDAPVLGVCFGAQLLAEATGGAARPAPEPEIGWREVRLETGSAPDPVLDVLPRRFPAFEWHSYEIHPGPGTTVLAPSDCCRQAFRASRHAWGIQFHAEVTAQTVEAWVVKDASEEV